MDRYLDAPAGIGKDVDRSLSGHELALLAACLRGRKEAYEPVVRSYQRRLFGLLVRLVRDRAAAEDLTQEAFLMAYRKLDRYDFTRPFWPWLLRIALNLGRRWLRSSRRTGTPVEPAWLDSLRPDNEGVGDPAELRERVERLERALAALPVRGRVALLLKFHEGLSYRDMSQALGAPVAVLKMRVSRARAKLIKLLDEQPQARVVSR